LTSFPDFKAPKNPTTNFQSVSMNFSRPVMPHFSETENSNFESSVDAFTVPNIFVDTQKFDKRVDSEQISSGRVYQESGNTMQQSSSDRSRYELYQSSTCRKSDTDRYELYESEENVVEKSSGERYPLHVSENESHTQMGNINVIGNV